MSRRVTQMDKNLSEKLLLVAQQSIKVARHIPYTPEDTNTLALESDLFSLINALHDYRKQRFGVVFHEGSKA